MEGAGTAPIAGIVSKNAVAFGDELLDRFEHLFEAEFPRGFPESESAARPLLADHDSRSSQLAQELAEVVRRSSRGGGNDLGIGVASLFEGRKVGEGLEGVYRSLGKDGDLLIS